jgi:ribonucleoside-diphosphate reductase alpha chain
MREYRPPFADSYVESVARNRGLLAPGEYLLDGIDRVARGLAELDASLTANPGSFATDIRAALLSGRIAVSSQLFSAIGRSTNAAACTVLPVAGTNDTERIQRAVAEATVASTYGMGCGLDLTQFDDPASAAVSVNNAMHAVHAHLTACGARPPALMLTCSSAHPSIVEFINVKRDADFSAWVANISVRVDGDDLEWARLRPLVAEAAHRNGEPGVLFQTAADLDNATPTIELTSTAPCAEVFLSPGERCVFVSINLAAHVVGGLFDWGQFTESVRLAVRAGDAAVELAAEGAAPVVAARRRIGVGVCGFHSALIRMGMPYARSAVLAADMSEVLTFTAHRASADLAIERGAFPMYADSRWTDAAWVARKAHHRAGAVPPEDWTRLAADATTTGMRNAAIVAYPPTGVVATLLGVSRSYEPHFTLVGRTGIASTADVALAPEVAGLLAGREEGALLAGLIMQPSTGYQVPGAAEEDILASARQIPPSVHMAVHAAFSLMADEAGSKTVNMPTTAKVEEVAALLDSARQAQLKGITVFRDGCLDERMLAA